MGMARLAPAVILFSSISLISVSPAAAQRSAPRPTGAHAFATWRADAGTMVLELDPQALAGVGVLSLQHADGAASDGSFVFNVSGADSQFDIVTRDGDPFRIAGYLQTRGLMRMPGRSGLLADNSLMGDFAVSLGSEGGWLTDQTELFRTIFEMNTAEIALVVDEAAETMVITAPIVISESFAHEVLRNHDATGTVVGSLSIDTALSLVSIDTPEFTPPAHEADPRGGTPNGPDVIVSNIGSTLSLYGTLSGVSAYAMTTVSCNLGEQDAIWIDCLSGPQCNQHPVIVQNMYRLKSSRFEHIGLAWLKHGWCAADAPSCGSPYESNGSCDWLGTHATDTYGASLNAAQDDLGPRSEVNAWTGVFPYPYILNWNQTGNSTYKRLQIKVDDINPAMNSGALYFGESQYVATDEQPINRYNNCTYRRVTVGTASGGSWNLNFTGSSITQQPAINAWAANDTGVTLVNIDVPDDGRLILGYKVTDLGGGTWSYEYALYNMNSHRSVQSFNVPADEGLVVSDIGFHDVDYHSGEPYSLTDWPGAHGGGLVSWATQTYATNQNANALRWSTLYNFRFNADVPPEAGTIELGLFRPGTPSSVSVSAMVPSIPFCACEGDLDDSGTPDGLDLQMFIDMYLGNEAITRCADVASPSGAPLDGADVSKFLDKILEGVCSE